LERPNWRGKRNHLLSKIKQEKDDKFPFELQVPVTFLIHMQIDTVFYIHFIGNSANFGIQVWNSASKTRWGGKSKATGHTKSRLEFM